MKIVNRDNGYTNVNKSKFYLGRKLAALVSGTLDRPIEIRMLDAAELAVVRSEIRRNERDPVTGSFEWYVGDSGGSQLVKSYTGLSGGMRVFKAEPEHA